MEPANVTGMKLLLLSVFFPLILSSAHPSHAGEEDEKERDAGTFKILTRSGSKFGHNVFGLGDIKISGSIQGDMVSIGSHINIGENKPDSPADEPEDPQDAEFKAEVRALFSSIDKNVDGHLDDEELLEIFHENSIDVSETKVEQLVAVSDGFHFVRFLNLFEFAPSSNTVDMLHFMVQATGLDEASGYDDSEYRQQVLYVFMLLDRDYDGELFVSDLITAFSDMGESIGVADAQSLLLNDDGGFAGVSFEQWRRLLHHLGEKYEGKKNLLRYWRKAFAYFNNRRYVEGYVETTGDRFVERGINRAEQDIVRSLAAADIVVSKCGVLKIGKVERSWVKFMDGIYYKLKLRLASSRGNDCKVVKVCDNVVAFRPLPIDCADDVCLKVDVSKVACEEITQDGDCTGKPCGSMSCTLENGRNGMCNGNGICVDPKKNPCGQHVHGCAGKDCGDRCLMGDYHMKGWCDVGGECKAAPSNCNVYGCEGKECGDRCLMGDDHKEGWCDVGGECKPSSTNCNVFLFLEPGKELTSLNGLYKLVMRTDGNLVLLTKEGEVEWSTNTGVAGSYLSFQEDGDLLIYESDGETIVWSSGTAEQGAVELQIHNDGFLALYGENGKIVWRSSLPKLKGENGLEASVADILETFGWDLGIGLSLEELVANLEDNKKLVVEVNKDPASSWTASIGKFSIYDSKYIEHKYSGQLDTSSQQLDEDSDNFEKEFLSNLQLSTLPEAVDLTERGSVTRAKNQGECAGATFAEVSALETCVYNKMDKSARSKERLDLSEQNLMDCGRNYSINSGCNGGDLGMYFKWLTGKYVGMLAEEEDYPYVGKDAACRAVEAKNAGILVTGYAASNRVSEEQVKALINEGHQVATTMSIVADLNNYNIYKGNKEVFQSAQCCDFADFVDEDTGSVNFEKAAEANCFLDHAVTIVGYGTEEEVPYWKVKNSWGEDWGNTGFMKIVRGKKHCGITSYVVLPMCTAGTPEMVPRPPVKINPVAPKKSETCGGELTEVSGFISSENYPDPYPVPSTGDTFCEWKISSTGNEDMVIKFTIEEFSVAGWDSLCQGTDWLQFFEEDGSTFSWGSREPGNQGKICGNLGPQFPIYSKGPSAKLVFLSTSYQNPKPAGFRIKYEFVEKPVCQNQVLTIASKSEKKTFTTPDYPDYYQLNSLCDWTVRVPGGLVAALKFEDYEVASQGSFHQDVTIVYDGDDDKAKQIVVYEGMKVAGDKPGLVVASGNNIHLTFLSNEIMANRGFKVEAFAMEKCEFNIDMENNKEVDISSFGYPDIKYPPNYKCMWTITAGLNEIVKFELDEDDMKISNGEKITFENGKEKVSYNPDLLKIWDGGDMTGTPDVVINEQGKEWGGLIYLSTGRVLTVVFAPGANSGEGFKAHVSSIAAFKNRRFELQYGGKPVFITSPHYPGNCHVKDKSYSPIDDIPDQGKTVEDSAEACQRRCFGVSGCSYFSFWQDGGCHLSSSAATLRSDPRGTISGPKFCSGHRIQKYEIMEGNEEADWTFTAKKSMLIRFEITEWYFESDQDGELGLFLYNDLDRKNKIEHISGPNSPPLTLPHVFKSTAETMLAVFKSAFLESRGFKATITPTCEDKKIELSGRKKEQLSSVDDGKGSYIEGVCSAWTITVPTGQKVQLQMDLLDIRYTIDTVKIYDGPTDQSELIEQIGCPQEVCDPFVDLPTFTGTTNAMHVHFGASSKNAGYIRNDKGDWEWKVIQVIGKGFRATASAVNDVVTNEV